MKTIDGKFLANAQKESLKKRIEGLQQKLTLAIITSDNELASKVYVNAKQRLCEELDVGVEKVICSGDTHEQLLRNVIEAINACNENPLVSGILLQLPLLHEGDETSYADERILLDLINPEKDVDCLSIAMMGVMYGGYKSLPSNLDNLLIPCTAKAVLKLIDFATPIKNLVGKQAVVVGQSDLVGRPVARMLTNAGLTVTQCHSKTINLEYHTSNADVVVLATGKPELVEHVKDGAIVIDVGITRNEQGKLVGDFKPTNQNVSYSTVPGGVGPMTVTMLVENLVILSECRQRLRE